MARTRNQGRREKGKIVKGTSSGVEGQEKDAASRHEQQHGDQASKRAPPRSETALANRESAPSAVDQPRSARTASRRGSRQQTQGKTTKQADNVDADEDEDTVDNASAAGAARTDYKHRGRGYAEFSDEDEDDAPSFDEQKPAAPGSRRNPERERGRAQLRLAPEDRKTAEDGSHRRLASLSCDRQSVNGSGYLRGQEDEEEGSVNSNRHLQTTNDDAVSKSSLRQTYAVRDSKEDALTSADYRSQVENHLADEQFYHSPMMTQPVSTSVPETLRRRPLHGAVARETDSFDMVDGLTEDGCKDWDRKTILLVVVVMLFVNVGGAMTLIALKDTGGLPGMQQHANLKHVEEFKAELEQLKSVMGRQSGRSWATILAPVKRILTEDQPRYPGVLLLASTGPRGARTATCIANNVSQTLTSVHTASGPLMLDASQWSEMLGGEVKTLLDEQVRSAVKAGSKVILLETLGELEAEAAMMLHGLCDNSGAPYKDIYYVFTLNIPVSGVEESLDQKAVETYLRKLWLDHIGEDSLPALFSRIANNVVFIQEESDDTLQNCHHSPGS